MVNYDSSVLQKFADQMYARASRIVLIYGLIGAFFAGPAVGVAFLAALAWQRIMPDPLLGLGTFGFGWLIAVVVAAMIGEQRAFMFKLEAQRTLCQLQIETNTRNKAQHVDDSSNRGAQFPKPS